MEKMNKELLGKYAQASRNALRMANTAVEISSLNVSHHESEARKYYQNHHQNSE